MEAECLSEIIQRLHGIVSWNKVQKPATREKIWALYIKGKIANFKVKGFSAGELITNENEVQITCNFKAVTPLVDLSEDTILRSTGLIKYF